MISVCIPTHNRDHAILEYVIKQWFAIGADEVTLGNTGALRIKLSDPRVFELHVPQNVWRPGLARNFAAMAAVGDVLIHTGADIIVSKGNLSHLQDLSPDIIETCAECKMLSPGETQEALHGKRIFNTKRIFPKPPGAIIAVRRDVFALHIGYFDNEMVNWGWEDPDLLHRAERIGIKCKIGTIHCIHLHHPPPIPRDMSEGSPNAMLMVEKVKTNWYRYES